MSSIDELMWMADSYADSREPTPATFLTGSDLECIKAASERDRAALRAALESALQAEYERGRQSTTIDTGDHVRHAPSGEEWLVAYVRDGRLTCCGWPESVANLSDCTLVKKASAAERLSLLQQMANSDGSRAAYARARLAEPEQAAEPVGWFKFDRVSQCYHPQYDEYASTHAAKEGWVKLYAAPPKREPLAPEQIDSIIGQCKQRGTTDDGAVIISAQDLYDFARAVERAHGIGETP